MYQCTNVPMHYSKQMKRKLNNRVDPTRKLPKIKLRSRVTFDLTKNAVENPRKGTYDDPTYYDRSPIRSSKVSFKEYIQLVASKYSRVPKENWICTGKGTHASNQFKYVPPIHNNLRSMLTWWCKRYLMKHDKNIQQDIFDQQVQNYMFYMMNFLYSKNTSS